MVGSPNTVRAVVKKDSFGEIRAEFEFRHNHNLAVTLDKLVNFLVPLFPHL